LNWAYADTPSSRDVTKFSGLVTEDGEPKPWGLAFRELAARPGMWITAPGKPDAVVDFDVDRAIVDPRAGDAMLVRYVEAWKVEKECGLNVR
jgi:hypothetical protein